MALLPIGWIAILAIGSGILRGLPVWLYWIMQRLFGHSPSKINLPVIILVGLFSFTTVLYSYTYQFIVFEYEMTLVSAPYSIYEEKTKYHDDAINEAVRRSLVPSIFQKNCPNKPEPVCELGKGYTLELWDSNFALDFDDAPLYGAVVASLASIFFVLLGDYVFQNW